MKNLILVSLVFLMNSCSSDEPNEQINLEAGIGFYVVNELGEDLLNPNRPNAINFEDIKVFNLINGKEINAYNPNSDAPKGISLDIPNEKYDKYQLSLGFNILEDADITYTIIQWNESDRDVFKVQFNRGDNFLIANKVWLNEKLVWNLTNNGEGRFFTLTK